MQTAQTLRPMNLNMKYSNSTTTGEALRAQIEEAWTQRHDVELPFQLARDHPDLSDDLLDFFDHLVSMTIAPTPTDKQEEEVAQRLQTRLRQTGQSHLADAIERIRSAADPSVTPNESGSDPDGVLAPTIAPSPTSLVSNLGLGLRPDPADSQWPDDCQDYYDYADRFGYGPSEISAAFRLPVATAHELIIHSNECPPRAQQEMARRGADGLEGTDYDLGLRYLSGQQDAGLEKAQGVRREYQSAASRSSNYSGNTGFSYEETIRNAPSSFPEEERAFWLALADDQPSQ